MDAIEALDWGTYSHFRYTLSKHPALLPLMQLAYHLSDYVAIGILFSLTAILFTWQGKYRSAQITSLSLAVGLAIVFAIRWIVPRSRPSDAYLILGPHDLVGSYPSLSVCLFTQAMVLIGFALWRPMRHPSLRGIYVGCASALVVWVFLAQLMLAVHFFTDALGGLALGGFLSLLTAQFLDSSENPQEP